MTSGIADIHTYPVLALIQLQVRAHTPKEAANVVDGVLGQAYVPDHRVDVSRARKVSSWKIFTFRAEESPKDRGGKCNGCNYPTDIFHVLAENRRRARELLKSGDAGACGDCFARFLADECRQHGLMLVN